jgi:hypothetical protein
MEQAGIAAAGGMLVGENRRKLKEESRLGAPPFVDVELRLSSHDRLSSDFRGGPPPRIQSGGEPPHSKVASIGRNCRRSITYNRQTPSEIRDFPQPEESLQPITDVTRRLSRTVRFVTRRATGPFAAVPRNAEGNHDWTPP